MSKRLLTGKVTSDKMQKSVAVSVETPKRHALYGKLIKNTRKYLVSNELNAKMGDTVVIEESKPISKRINWIVKEIIESK